MNILRPIRVYFNIRPDLEEKQYIVSEITKGISFRGANLWILITAIFIASLGLNVNSTAVIIGAMLISPLMGPIIGMGLAVGIYDLDLLKRAAKNFSIATVISVLTATIYFLLSPLGEAQSELLARTSPTIFDVLIAFFGGVAGIIATALMPPLCTAGYGIASGSLRFFLGAFYLFFINTVFISLATAIGVRMMKFPAHSFLTAERAKKAKRILSVVVIATIAPAVVMTVNIIRTSIFENNVHRFVTSELSQSGTQILTSSADRQGGTLRIVAVGREISDSLQRVAEGRLANYGLSGFQLNVIQGVQSDSLLARSIQIEQHTSTQSSDHQKLLELSTENSALAQRLSEYSLYEEYAHELRSELAVLFPSVRTLSLTPVVEVQTDTTLTSRYIAVLLGLESGKALPAPEQAKLQQWFKARVPADSLVVITKPSPER